jgi:catechol 2,3-dioxygenase-like lactoylglutathione lyase family enzyme
MIASLDHFVLATRDLARCLHFYVDILGMRKEIFGQGRIALRFGDQKINVHHPEYEADIVATLPTPGSLDLCFLADRPLDAVIAHLQANEVKIEKMPSIRTGARFPIRSIYLRDPDGNLVEISEPAQKP